MLMMPDIAERVRGAHGRWRLIVLATLLLLLAAGLFARVMTYPLRHDEQLFVPAAALASEGALYRDFGYNHLPNLPLLLNAVLTATGGDSLVLVGRLAIFLCWLLAAAALVQIARRAGAGVTMAAIGILFLAAEPILQGPAGMMVTNNFMPVPFALWGFYFFLDGAEGPRPIRLLVSGLLLAVAVGLKANYVFLVPSFAVAALLVPRRLGIGRRLGSVTLPLLAGGIIGGLPTLYHLAADPAGFLAHVTGYHRGPHVAFWQAAPEPKVMGVGEKLLLAEDLWLGGTAVLLALIVFTTGIVRWEVGRQDIGRDRAPFWPVPLAAALVVLGIMVSFVPTPAFPQYFLPPIPFAIVLAILLYGQLDAMSRRRARPTIIAAVVIAAAVGLPRLLVDLPKLATPSQWTAMKTEQLAARIAAHVERGKVATLAPIYPLEAGLEIYPELAAGPFVYRVADLIPPADRRHYRLVSAASLPALLDSDPPAGILVGLEDEFDPAFVDYAQTRNYVRVPLPQADTRYGTLTLFVPPARR